MTENFTPGPWVAFITSSVTEVQDTSTFKPIVGWTGFDDSRRSKNEHRANARLIAAAPDLYVVAADALDHLTDALCYPDDDPLVKDLRAALARARVKDAA